MAVTVHVGSILFDYTGGKAQVSARGRTVAEVLTDLDQRHPGLRFRIVDEQDRIRSHIKIFVGEEAVDELTAEVAEGGSLHVLAALSGG